MVKLSLILCVLTVFALVGVKSVSSETNAPTPSKDCSTIVFSMADCLSFVTNGSNYTKPEGGCCSGLKTVVKTDAQCLCEAFKSSSQLGIVLNVTKALTLPSVCGVHAPSISKCGLSAAGSAPAQYPQAPSPSPTSSKQGSPTPAPAPESGNGTPSPAPAQSHASSTSTVSFLTLFASLVVASCFSYSY